MTADSFKHHNTNKDVASIVLSRLERLKDDKITLDLDQSTSGACRFR